MSYNNKYNTRYAEKSRNTQLQMYKDIYGTTTPSQFDISTKFREAKTNGNEQYVFMSIYDQPADKHYNDSVFLNPEDRVNKRIIKNSKIRIAHNKRAADLNSFDKINYFE